MQKIIIILLVGIYTAGCSATQHLSSKNEQDTNIPIGVSIIENVKFLNITNSNFFIQKAEIQVINENGKETFIGTIKFEKPDKYLISIKSKTGIEGARIYITKDSLFVNDRINKKMYYGSSFYLKKKFGLDQNFLPLIFGDIILNKNCEDIQRECVGNKMTVNCVEKGIMLNYEIDCRKSKAISVNQMNNFVKNGIEMKYSGFHNIGNIIIPRVVEFKDNQYNSTVNIKVIKIELPWNGSIKFIPGKGYELIELV